MLVKANSAMAVSDSNSAFVDVLLTTLMAIHSLATLRAMFTLRSLPSRCWLVRVLNGGTVPFFNHTALRIVGIVSNTLLRIFDVVFYQPMLMVLQPTAII